jgi:hypothetical protein
MATHRPKDIIQEREDEKQYYRTIQEDLQANLYSGEICEIKRTSIGDWYQWQASS